MVAYSALPARRTKVLLFGPQALSFHEESFNQLRSTLLNTPDHCWILDAIEELQNHWEILTKALPRLEHIRGTKLLENLNDWLRAGNATSASFPLPNILLTPLVVATELAQYSRYQKNARADHDGQHILHSSVNQDQNAEALGFCTGLLSALAVASSASQTQLQKYGAVAIRLAMLIGAWVDAQDTSTNLYGESISFSAAWSSTESEAELTRILKSFPEAYVSVRYDEKRVTLTTSKSTAPSLVRELRTAGITTAEVGLRGRFHWDHCRKDLESLIRFCDMHPAFQLPDASELVIPTRPNSGGDYITHGKLHHVALQSILVEQSEWYQTFAAVQSSRLIYEESAVVTFGPDRCIPPTLRPRLGPRLLSIAEHDFVTPRLSGSSLDPEAPVKESRDISDNAIAIIGMSCKVAGADDLDEFWKILCDGKSQHAEVPESRFGSTLHAKDSTKRWFANLIKDPDAFDHKFFRKSPREIASMDPQQRLMLQVAYQTVEQTGYFRHQSCPDKHIGCYIGAGCVDYENNIACYPPNAFSATGNLKSFISGRISHYFGWTGPALTIDTACSASAVAIHQACKAILSGECAAALAGGVTVITSPQWFRNLAGASFLSPTGACKPFDAKADGYCRGDGIGAVFLKKMASAVADGDQILGTIASTAVCQNQNCTPITVPNAESLSDLFRNVIKQAHVDPKQISAVEAHGTGTPVGDPAEYESIRQVLGGPRPDPVSLSSVKGLIGHTETASGVIALIKTILMIQEGFIPPQASFETINPALNFSPSHKLEIPTTLRSWDVNVRIALINNYGASGSNASMVICQAPKPRSKSKDMSEMPLKSLNTEYPFWFCGFDDSSLRLYAAKLRQFLRRRQNISIASLAFNVSRQSNRSLGRALILHCRSIEDLEKKLQEFEDGDENVSSIARQPSRPVVLCFGGQISTFVGLDREVFESAAILRSHLDQCDSICQKIGLEGGIYPEIFQRTPVEDTVKFQILLFAMQYSCAKSWIDCGIQVAAVVGHSFGELTSLCVSGSLSLIDTMKLIARRASLIRDSWGPDKGSMMAIEADLSDVEKLLAESRDARQGESAPTIACFNGPRSFTLAGTTQSIEAVEETVARKPKSQLSMKIKKLGVSNAFHSTLVDPLLPGLKEVGRELTFKKPTIPFERAIATESTHEDTLTSEFPAEHMRNPVYFDHAIRRLSARYPGCMWLEAGSNSTVTIMANRALGSSTSHYFQGINITSDHSLQHLTEATVNLWKEGVDVSFWPHHSSQVSEYVPLLLPPYQFERSRHWLELKTPQKADTPPSETEPPKNLWTFCGYQGEGKRSARFQINTRNKKFEEYVSGHTIARAAPLCPSTLQVDIVIEALRELRPDFAASNYEPQLQGLENHAPMCIDKSRQVWLDCQTSDADSLVWEWKMVSNAIQGSPNEIMHVSGMIIFRSADDPQMHQDFARFEGIVGHHRCLSLLDGNAADDAIQGRNIYKTFAEIVDYGDIYRGVQKIAGKGEESAGRVVKAYTGHSWLDTPLSDSFCQVAGIFVNCMTNRPDKDIYISNGINKWIRSPKLRPTDTRPGIWDVFAYHRRPSEKEFISDIFIFDSRDGTLLEMILGVSYQKVSKVSLAKALSRLTTDRSNHEPEPSSTLEKIEDPVTEVPPSSAKNTQANDNPTPRAKKTSQTDISNSVKSLLANVSGLEPDDIKDNTELAEIGIDSLMGMELAREIETVFKCSLDVAELSDITDFNSLLKCIVRALGTVASDATSEDKQEVNDEADRQSEIVNDNKTMAQANGTTHIANRALPNADSAAPYADGLTQDMKSNTSQKVTGVLSNKNSTGPHINGFTRDMNGDSPRTISGDLNVPATAVLEAFGEVKVLTDEFIRQNQFGDYADCVLPRQTELCIAHIIEAFEKLGHSLRMARQGQKLERIQYLPKHENFVEILYQMLDEARLIDIHGSQITRTAVPAPTKSADALLQDLIREHPIHANDSKLTHVTGSKLAECLSGKSDGIQLIFGSEEGRDLVSGLYGASPINMVWLKQMEHFIESLVSRLAGSQGPLRILEVGAGTGGTTAGMAPLLARLKIPVEYTFTDISSSMVASARKRFKQNKFMSFRTLDIEKPPAADLLHTQHIVIANNCIHATHSLTNSLKNIHDVLRHDGFLMMIEMTDRLYWVDMIFGLLEGWWLFNDGRRHAVAHQSVWKKSLQSVGYGHIDWTEGDRPEADLQRMFIALASQPRYYHLLKSPKPLQGQMTDLVARQVVINDYIHRYTERFKAPDRSRMLSTPCFLDECVVVTGATGSLGSHLVAHFAEQPCVKTVICLNRRNSMEPKRRQQMAMESRGISLSPKALSKLESFQTDTAKPMMGLPESEYDYLTDNVTHIVHNAWPMSIKRPVKAFESQFQIMENLVDFAREISCKAGRPPGWKVGFQFISSIATVGHYPLVSGNARVPEERMSVESVLPSGYGDAKLVCERMLDETLHKHPDHFRPMAVRIGQIAGSRTSGYWNPVEHLSFLIKSSQSLKVLPDFQGELSWCPVNDVAATLSELLLSEMTPYPIYHIENPARQPWREVIPLLADALDIPRSCVIPFEDWVNRVRNFPSSETENPASKLVDFLDEHFIRMSCGGLILDTTKSREHSQTLANEGPVSADIVRKYVHTWKEMGFLKR